MTQKQRIHNIRGGTLSTAHYWYIFKCPLTIQDIISIFAYIKPGLFKKQKDYEAYDVRKNIAPYFLRRLKKDVLKELPDKIRQEQWLELDGDQRTHYDRILTAGRTELKSTLETNSEFRIRRHIFALLNKLKQVCNFAPTKSTSPKTEAMQELLEVIKENNELGEYILIPCYSEKDDIEKVIKRMVMIFWQLLTMGR